MYVGIPKKQFKRTVQRGGNTCAPCAVHSVLRTFDVAVPYNSVYQLLGTQRDGTFFEAIAPTIKSFGLTAVSKYGLRFRDLLTVLDNGGLVIASLDYEQLYHVAVMYGYAPLEKIVFLGDAREQRMYKKDFKSVWNRSAVLVLP